MAKFGFGNFINATLGNFSERTIEELTEKYGAYLFEEEEITMGYKLVRDSLIFTNARIIFIDKQGATGKKTSFKSIYLSSIVDVEMETAGFGVDDSEITITYLKNVHRRAHTEYFETKMFEFPKSTDIVPLYTMLGSIVLDNRQEINQ
ncbi:PH domain-containing protein [Isobaculum melis]|uniref:PH domain-containing protein n=1 Tax=Isobaculum melis TaxID=142588 RepID=A0A1H9RJU4_9LACT|nr:PH domain-containing protein [Isobaculum melis]SER73070.1 PH domain-containing protein [Isobaculum melis]